MFFSRLSHKLVLKSASARTHVVLSQRLSDFTKDAVDLSYKYYKNSHRDGTKNPVIILHGLLASKNSWAGVSEAIHQATGRSVISVDARNHGDSRHSSENTYIHMAKDMVNLMKKLDLPKVTLLGHSMGGRTAMVVSLLYTEQVSSLILVDVSPLSTSEKLANSLPRIIEILTNIDFKGITNVEDATRFARENLRTFGVTQKDVVSFILKNVGVKPDGTVGWISNMKVLKETLPTLLKFPHCHTHGRKFSGPTLFIGAEKSDFIPPEDFLGIVDYFPQAQLKYISGVGHNIHEEDPKRLLKLTTEFLIKYNV